MEKLNANCPVCSAPVSGIPKRSFLGFQRLLCKTCATTSTFPLTDGYRWTYWVLFGLMAVLFVGSLAQGQMALPGGFGAAILFVVIRDWTLRSRAFDLKKSGTAQAPEIGRDSIQANEISSGSTIAPDATARAPSIENRTAAPSTREIAASSPADDEDHWATALAELETGQRRPGLWAKVFAESDGDETKAKVSYLKTRVQQLSDAAQVTAAQDDANRKERIAKQHADNIEHLRVVQRATARFSTTGTISREELKLLVNQPDKSHLIWLSDSVKGNTLLHICAACDMLKETNALLQAGANPLLQNGNGQRAEQMTKSPAVRTILQEGPVSADDLKRLATSPG